MLGMPARMRWPPRSIRQSAGSWGVGYAICNNLQGQRLFMNRLLRIIFLISLATSGLSALAVPHAAAQDQPITIRAARVIDGKGKVLQNATVEVQGSKITKIDQRAGPVSYDLGK